MRWISWALATSIACGMAALPVIAQQSFPSSAATQTRFVVVIDAAHGGDDAGGRLSDGTQEKALTLALSARLRSLLAARGIQVVTTRDSDTSVESNRRAEIANRTAAQACILLHATESGSGIHLFVSPLAPAGHAHFVAWKTAQSGWISRSLALAGALNSALQGAGMKVSNLRTALPGMESMTCPAVAVEIAPEVGSDNEVTAGLGDAEYQARVVAALAAALVAWRADESQGGGTP